MSISSGRYGYTRETKNCAEGPCWTDAMDNTAGNTYVVRHIAQSVNGYYLIRIGDNAAERQWKFMDKWLKPVDYTLF